MIHELVDQVNAVVDGELVAFDAEGRNSFEALQQRMNLVNEREIKRISKADPRLDGRVRPAAARRARHDGPGGPRNAPGAAPPLVVETDDRLQLTSHVEGDGKAFAEAARGSAWKAWWRSGEARPTCPAVAPPTGARSSW
ncbi:MAG: hypothetical protein U0V56_00180 [Actinomycetota bacterium]